MAPRSFNWFTLGAQKAHAVRGMSQRSVREGEATQATAVCGISGPPTLPARDVGQCARCRRTVD